MTENLDVRDNISISLRRDENTAAIKKLVDEAPGRDFTEKIITAVKTYLAEDKERTDRADRERLERWPFSMSPGVHQKLRWR